MNALDQLLENLSNRKCALFCGAGISYNSGVPLVAEIKKKVLEGVPIESSDKILLLDGEMPFELFMECLLENAGDLSIMNLFALGNPNNNHWWIAEMARMGALSVIVTTNFDKLIEESLNDALVEYELIYREDHFARIDWDNDKVKLIKIHGSMHDHLDMAITIKNISSRGNVYSRNKVIHEMVNNDHIDCVLFLGYSCSDIFDISPALEYAPAKKASIYFLNHTGSRAFPQPFQSIKRKKEPNPFKEYKGFMCSARTEDFIKEISNCILKTSLVDEARPVLKWEEIVDVWLQGVMDKKGREFGYYLCGQLMVNATAFDSAIRYFEEGLVIIKKSGNTELQIDFLFGLGRSYHGLQTQESIPLALNYLEDGLNKCREEHPKKKCAILLSMGVIHMEIGNYKESVFYYTESYKMSRMISDRIIAGKCIGNLGIVLKNMVVKPMPQNLDFLYQIALILQYVALDISVDQGDKRSEGRNNGNIAILLSQLGQKNEAIDFELNALEIAVKLSDIYHQGIWNNNLGEDYTDLDDKKAMKYLREAARIFRKNKWKKFLATTNENINKLSKKKPA